MRKLLLSSAFCLLASVSFAQQVTTPAIIALACAYNSGAQTGTSGQFMYVQCDVNGKLLTSGAAPTGAAGGDLSGTYPNPTVAKIQGVTPGTGVATALGVNIGTAGSVLVNGGVLGTPSSGTVTNLTGTASININGTVGATTPTTGAFTTLVASTSLTLGTSGILLGGTNTIEQQNSTNGQTFNYYNTFTSGSVYERGFNRWVSNIFEIGTEQTGASNRSMRLRSAALVFFNTSGTDRWSVASTGILAPEADASYDFGTTGNRIRDMYVGRNPFFNGLSTDATKTDATVCTDTTSGQIYKGSGALGICLGTSGRQFKTAVSPMAVGVDELMKINFINYRYKNGYGDNGATTQYGTTAQDVEAAIPDIARHNINGETINFDSGALLFVGLRAIQQLKADNDNIRIELRRLKQIVNK